MRALDDASEPRNAFSFVAWLLGLYLSTMAATVAVANTVAIVHGSGPVDLFAPVAAGLMLSTVAAWPPGLLSFFLFALTDTRLRHQPWIGAAVFGAACGIFGGFSANAALYGAVFGLVSVGGPAGTIALYRSTRTQFSKRPFHG